MISSFKNGKSSSSAAHRAFLDHLADPFIVLSVKKLAPILDICIEACRDAYDIIIKALESLLHLIDITAIVQAQVVKLLSLLTRD